MCFDRLDTPGEGEQDAVGTLHSLVMDRQDDDTAGESDNLVVDTVAEMCEPAIDSLDTVVVETESVVPQVESDSFDRVEECFEALLLYDSQDRLEVALVVDQSERGYSQGSSHNDLYRICHTREEGRVLNSSDNCFDSYC